MKAVTYFAIALTLLAPATFAQDSAPETSLEQGYISDELFVYMHAGAGSNYRIVGSINAGDEIALTGEQANGYTQIIDEKDRTAWVESKFVSTNPSLRAVIAELNSKLASNNDSKQRLNEEISNKQATINELEQQNAALQSDYDALSKQHQALQLQVDNQDLELKKQYFFYGAMVLGIGLILGIILPHLTAKKRKTQSWN
ncbi:TIGR04211 family SH3 domain-containing protein [Thalassotalea sp. LPB0316]|uniref:TIGR04211 family SH3 domain-containing protein n=1 Tax=Thalassotalea sp. LPB0316 TaxID=2769490 RepID=UPI0018682FF6|nr:TIGR04211 family SH3 domain-containing protein [Thalassotalea sp. LPB0316]QOL26920.1 TIGR04211 family SH3 domain-containing protein [Thalassotalea sp. LPB0316]